MACNVGIGADIVSDCTTAGTGGNEITAWIFNRATLTPTYDVTTPLLVTSLAVDVGSQGFSITGVKKLLNSGSDVVVADDRPDKYTHYFSFQEFEFDAVNVFNVDNIEDVVVVVESKDKADDGDGVFRMYGLKYGLFKSTDTLRANDINGARSLELTSLAGQEEPYSRYVLLDTNYAVTKALLEGLMVIQT